MAWCYDSADNLLRDDIYLKLHLKYKFHHNQNIYYKALVLNLKLKSQMVYISNSCYTSWCSSLIITAHGFIKSHPLMKYSFV